VVLDEITPEHPWRDAVIEAVGAVRAAVELRSEYGMSGSAPAGFGSTAS
jgi:hypothetical protein